MKKICFLLIAFVLYSTTTFAAGHIVTSTIINNVNCAGGSNGSAYVTVSGGVGPYIYSWSSTPIQANDSLFNAPAGTYICTVTDQSDMSTATASVTIVQPPPLSINISSTNPTSCNTCDGTAQIIATGGIAPYSYMWIFGFNSYQSTQTMSNLCSGSYRGVINDANGCYASDSIILTSLGVFNYTSVPDTCGQSKGSATIVNLSGSQGALNYLWQPGNYTTQNISNIPSHYYNVIISDTACSYSRYIFVGNFASPGVSASSVGASCGNASGQLILNGYGGIAPYQYSVNGAAFSSVSNITGLLPGTYTIVCRDANNCQSRSIETNVQNTGINLSFNVNNTTCNYSNGNISSNVSGGTAGYTYLWMPGNYPTSSISNIAAGTYTCTVIDANGCTTSNTATVNNAATIYLVYDYDYYNCGVNSLTASPNFGAAPYTYSWAPGGQTTATISNLATGNYTCTVTDAIGCTGTGFYWIGNNSYSIVTGSVYADLNLNCTYDAGENSIQPISLVATNAAGQSVGWAYINNNNNIFTMYVPPVAGTYTISAYSGNYYNYQNIVFNCGNNIVSFAGICDTIQNLNLGYTPVTGQDLHVSYFCGTARPGFIRSNSIYYSNPGTTAVPATVKMRFDNLLSFAGSTPAPTNITGNLIEWNLGNITPGQSDNITVNTTVPTIQNGGALGTVLHDSVWIEPIAGDNFPSDNSSACSSAITGSYDPNMKEVYAANMDATGAIDTSATDLYYTVHFQNTGTDTAFTVVVHDTISSLLDLSTIEFIASSHPCKYTILPNRTIEARFDHILLADSNHNEALSHGYFHYKIRTNQGIQAGQQINNTAHIYFDFNPAVVTNTVVTPVQLSINGIKQNKMQLNAFVYPNPANNGSFKIQINDVSYKQLHFVMYNAAGMKVMDRNLTSQPVNEINTSGLSTGIYFYQLMNAEGKKFTGKIVLGE